MLLREGDHRTIRVDMGLALPLSAVAGAVNAAAFRAVGFFSANMTGNASSFSDYLAQGNLRFAAAFLGLVAAFVAGSFVSTFLIQLARRRAVSGVFAYSIAVEGILLGAVGAVDVAFPSLLGAPFAIGSLAFLMGLQNAATTLISNARVRTTHVSGTITDIGVELALLSGSTLDGAERQNVRARLYLHGLTVAAFVGGGVLGVLLYNVAAGWVFLACAITLLLVALPYVHRSRRAAEGAHGVKG